MKMTTLNSEKTVGNYGSIKRQNIVGTFFAMIFFSALCILTALPFITLFIGAFRPGQDLVRNGLSISLDWERMTLDNYKFLFTGRHSYFLWYKNSFILTVIHVSLSLLICYIVSYGLSMYAFRLRNILFFLVIATMMVPFEILMLPMYVEIMTLGLVDTLAGVILPGLCSAASIFFFRQYMTSIPKSLIEAGRIDGANEYRICFSVIMPNVKPAFAAMAILSAMNTWNAMLWPLLVYRDAKKFTLPIGLNTLLTPYGNNYDLLIAGSFFSVLPIFMLFILFQRYFIGGMTAGAVKG